MSTVKLHILHCGSISVPADIPYSGNVGAANNLRGVLAKSDKRISLPVSAYLIEHPEHGLILVDTGWSREIRPRGVYDPKAVRRHLPAHLAAFYRPYVPKGQTVREQLSAMGIEPRDLDLIILSHFDADHISGLRDLKGAKRVIVPAEERWWANRNFYKIRQPESLRRGIDIEHVWYKGTPDVPMRWARDIFGDESVQLICLAGHTEGQAGIKITNGKRFAVLASDAAFSPRSWREGIVPGYGFNPQYMKLCLDWLKAQENDPNCVAVIANHDPDIEPQTIEI